MRVVVDTNVFISALLSPHGAPGQVLRSAREGEGFELVLSESLTTEYRRVALYPSIQRLHKLPPAVIDEFISALRRFAILVEQLPNVDAVADDPDDNLIVATAIAGGAEYIVSGDRHLLQLQVVHDVAVLPPAAFLLLVKR